MINYIKLENLESFDTCKKRVITVEPDLYINQSIHTRVFLRNDFFGGDIGSFNVEKIPAIISPSIFTSSDTLEGYIEILVEPLQSINQELEAEFIFVIEESSYYLSGNLFDFIFGRDNADILIDSSC